MKRIKLIIGLLLVIFTGFVAFGLFSMPDVRPAGSELFSAERVKEDIKVISKEHHSIEHPLERAAVRQYLFDRLVQLGGSPEFFYYDSLKCKFGGTFDIGNVYCAFEPINGKAASYVMFVAHLDSRFKQKVLEDTVYSFGAADDGYGLGVSLESLNCALKYRDDWKQGVKILFTDSEEHELDGMREALANDRAIFDNVGLIINIEARGVKGPALLFETSSGNADLMDLYNLAKYPYTYSITTAVYKKLPNFTDFTLVKDSLPGLNFSVIDNLKYYHTDKDNFDNISLKSIQHYGVQIEPILKEYLTDSQYSDPGILNVSGENSSFFSLPGLGLIKYPEKMNLLYDSIVFALLCIAFIFYILSGGMKSSRVFKSALFIFITALAMAAVGEGLAYVSALIVGTPFKLMDTKYIEWDNIISIAALALMVVCYVTFFIRKKRKSPSFVKEQIFGAMIGMMAVSAVLYFLIGDNFFFTVPIGISALAMIFYMFVFLNFLSLPALLIIELLELSFLYVLLTALTIGSLGIVMFIAFYSIILMVSLFECYMNQKR